MIILSEVKTMIDEYETMICEVWNINGSNIITIKKRFSVALGIHSGDYLKIMVKKVHLEKGASKPV